MSAIKSKHSNVDTLPVSGMQRPGIGRLGNGVIVVLSLMTIVLAGCRGATTESNSLRIAVLPILDSLPLYVADAEGYFSAEGVSVEMVPVASSSERDQLLQAEQIDGVITDLVALALYNRESPQVLGLRFAMVPTEDDAQFRLLTAADTGFKTVEDLSGVPIGVSKGTIIEYVTQGMLTREGLPPEAIHTLAVPKIPERMALLNSGDLAAATLPEPLAALAIQKGATVVIDDRRHPKLSGSLYAFRAEVVESKPDAMTAFFAAIEQATEAINEDALHWEPLLREQRVIPPTLEGELVLPTYPGAAIPDAGQFRDVVAWLQASGRLESAPAYADVITDRYLTE